MFLWQTQSRTLCPHCLVALLWSMVAHAYCMHVLYDGWDQQVLPPRPWLLFIHWWNWKMLHSNESSESPFSQEQIAFQYSPHRQWCTSATGALLSACRRRWLRTAVDETNAALEGLQFQDGWPHSPYCLDLVSSDFWLFSKIEEHLKGTRLVYDYEVTDAVCHGSGHLVQAPTQ